ncbi:hypothetical protein V8B55DRAFT_1550603 [Mucor lusitanicus]
MNLSQKEQYQSFFKQKADILTLKIKPDSKVEWPGNLKKRRLYMDTSEESVAKVGITKQRQFKRTPWDPQLNRKAVLTNLSMEKSELDTSIVDDLTNFVNCSKLSAGGNREMDRIDNQDTSLIKDLSLQLIDQVLMNMANPFEKDSSETRKILIGNLCLPTSFRPVSPSLIERVKRHMALATGKKTPAITALNVYTMPLSDLTISDTELEMKATIQQLYAQTETESFESLPDGDVYQDMRWLMNLSRKDDNDQISEIATINEEYSNRVLNLKPVFF